MRVLTQSSYPAMNRRDWFKSTVLGAATVAGAEMGAPDAAPAQESQEVDKAEIYKLLGFATMTGEGPLTMWARLRNTKAWLAGPLSPDAWCGQVFIADNADIFAFRFLSLPSAWMKDYESSNRAAFCGQHFASWFSKWPGWWRTIGPKAPDDSYARLIWQMPDDGPRVTYEWARTGSNEIVCRITNSAVSDMLLQGYVPWDSHPPDFSVLYSESADRNFLRGRSWVPGTRDGMRWVLALSEPVHETAGAGTTKWNGYIPQVKTLYLCGKQGQTYERLEEETRGKLDKEKIDQLLDRNRRTYEAQCGCPLK
jgi:hypothetical protein